MKVEENILLRPLTTFHIGGPARFFVRATSLEELKEALLFAKENRLSVFILGGGSNILVDDAGFSGLVIKIELKGVEEQNGLLVAEAGEEWDTLGQCAISKNLWGIENLSGIPGSVGAAPVQNIGAYGTELKDTLAYVEALDTSTLESKRFARDECEFEYRSSRFKKQPGSFVITKVALKLDVQGRPNLSYRDLEQHFAGNQYPTLSAIREAVLAIRAKKFPDLRVEGTAGSFFLNPIVSLAKATKLREAYPELPQFPASGGIKISLAWLLDCVLKAKGMRVGSVRCFERQPLVIVAEKNSRAADVKALAQKISALVQENFGITIEPEVRVL